ncbi:MAG: type II secretion system F family protein [Clostridiales bacterium]|nr:type II secretion system F family protein [Clostridiales bacterium]
MPKYEYKASNISGQTIEGVYDAQNEESVRSMLREKAFYPIQISRVVEGIGTKEIKLFNKIPIKVLTIFCQQFAAILKAGVPLTKGLSIMNSQTDNKSLRRVLADVYEQVQMGKSLSSAFRSHDDKFPNLFFSILEAGEISGTLDNSFERLGNNFEKDYKLQGKIKNAMMYPAVVSVVAVAVVLYLLAAVVPTFVGIFESAGADLPGVTKVLLVLSGFVQSNFILLIGIILLIIVALRVLLKTRKFRFNYDKGKLSMPMLGKLNAKILASRFTRTLCTLFSAGVPLTSSLEITSRALSNTYVEQGVMEVADNVKEGRMLADCLEDLDVFPSMVVHMTRVGEESGTLEDMLEKTSDFFTSEADDAVTRMMALLEPAIIVVLGGMVMFIVIAILLPMFQMMSII